MPKFLAKADLQAGAGGYSFPVSFHLPGTLSTGVKTPEFLAPVAMTVTTMLGRCGSGTGATYRPVKEGATNGTTSAATSTTTVTTAQSLSLAAGDRLALEVVAAGSGADLSVTFWIKVT